MTNTQPLTHTHVSRFQITSVCFQKGNSVSKPRSMALPEEVAEYIRKPVRTLEQWRYRGIGPRWTKVGRDVRYRWEDVDRWLDEQSKAAA